LDALVESNGSKDCELIKILREQQDYLEKYCQDWQKKISALTSQLDEKTKLLEETERKLKKAKNISYIEKVRK